MSESLIVRLLIDFKHFNIFLQVRWVRHLTLEIIFIGGELTQTFMPNLEFLAHLIPDILMFKQIDIQT